MASITDKFGKSSIDSDYAIATTVKTVRLSGVSVLEAIDLSKYATATPVFVVTYKKTTNPTTSVVSVTDLVSWKALVNAGANTLTNLTVAPGYTDTGNAIGDFIECIPTSYWENSLIDGIRTSLNDDGTLKNNSITTEAQFTDNVDPVLRASENMFDHVASGCVITGTGYGSTLAWSMTSGVVYIGGKRLTVASATGTVTATKDTYFDLLDPGTGTVATLVNTGGNIVTVNATSPALASNSVRIGIIQSGANIASVASINQGQEDKVLPIASSTPYTVNDSLGNLICPRDPQRKLLGLRRVFSNLSVTNTAYTALNNPLSCPVIIPAGRKVEVSAGALGHSGGGAIGNGASGAIYDSTSSVQVRATQMTSGGANYQFPCDWSGSYTPPTSGARVFSLQGKSAGGAYTMYAQSGTPVELRIKLL